MGVVMAKQKVQFTNSRGDMIEIFQDVGEPDVKIMIVNGVDEEEELGSASINVPAEIWARISH